MSRDRPAGNARNVRRRHVHTSLSSLLLLAGGTVCPSFADGAGIDPSPTYMTVVVAEPAQSQSAREDNAASSSTVVTADRAPRSTDSVTQILSEQAGAVVTRLGGMGSTATLSLRGSTANQVSLYMDGVPLNTVTGGGVDLGAIPVGDVERIEIYRGMSPIAFGSSAIGGVVSISTAVPTSDRIDADLGGGSFGTRFGGVRGALVRGRLRLYGGVHAIDSDGDFPYTDPANTNLTATDDRRTRRRNNDLRQLDGLVRAVVDLDQGRRLSAGLLFFGRDQGLPGMASLANPVARLGTMRATTILGYESPQALGPGGRLRATMYGTYERSHFDDPHPDISSIPTDARDRTRTGGATVTAQRPLAPWWVLSGLMDARFDRFTPSETDTSGSPGTRLFGAVGLESDFWIQRLGLDILPSARVEFAREHTSGRDDFDRFLPTSGAVNHVLPIVRLSVIKELTGCLSLRANGGRYARLPSLIELYGNTGFLLGNPTLRPERGLNADIGPLFSWRRGAHGIRWTTAAFASLVDDLIQYQFGGGHARSQNLGSARILGVETDATVDLGRHFRAVLSGTFSDPRNTSPVESQHDKVLPFRPRYRFYARPEVRAIPLGPRVSLGVYAEVDGTGRNFLVSANTVAVPARMVFGAGIYAHLPGGFTARLSGQNLTDANIYDISNYPLPGRELYASLAWSQKPTQQGTNE